jgi:hypothetical protein
VAAFLIGRLLLTPLSPRAADTKVWCVLLGVLVYLLLAAIPYLGWLVAVAATFFGLGAIWMTFAYAPDRSPLTSCGLPQRASSCEARPFTGRIAVRAAVTVIHTRRRDFGALLLPCGVGCPPAKFG